MLAGQCGMRRPIRWNGASESGMGMSRDPYLASLSASSFPIIWLCALTFCMKIWWGVCWIWKMLFATKKFI